ncbi:MAG: BMC domain-containing protein [Candidatus Tectomicrobia bacterium]|uniref:BMC domain-containing protein n=1 Tax=Tectimicrobiota bacterium TaxID=2528274 RepID=A0A933GMH3_UNCTE|nr:BMC domain-containing protein [Candidatus Tectomicrobia bacterium]
MIKFSLGFAEERGLAKLAKVTDGVLKSVNVRVTRYEKIGGGFVTICFIGDLASVKHGIELAAAMGIKTALIASPGPVVLALLGLNQSPQTGITISEQRGRSDYPAEAIGMIETRGFVPMVMALDAMEKAAHIKFMGYDTLGEGLVTAAVYGDISSVKHSLEAGEMAAGRAGEFVSAELISKPQLDMFRTLPKIEGIEIDRPWALGEGQES